QPTHYFGAPARRPVAEQPRLGMELGEVAEDRHVLGKRNVSVLQRRHSARRRIAGQIRRRIEAVVAHLYRLVRCADPFEHDVPGQRTATRQVVELHAAAPRRPNAERANQVWKSWTPNRVPSPGSRVSAGSSTAPK